MPSRKTTKAAAAVAAASIDPPTAARMYQNSGFPASLASLQVT